MIRLLKSVSPRASRREIASQGASRPRFIKCCHFRAEGMPTIKKSRKCSRPFAHFSDSFYNLLGIQTRILAQRHCPTHGFWRITECCRKWLMLK